MPCTDGIVRRRVLIRAKTPLRISFAGGGTDVPPFPEREGGLVLNATITRYAYGTLVPSSGERISVESVDFGTTETYGIDEVLAHDGKLDMARAAIRNVERRYPRPASGPKERRAYEGFELFLHSNAPPGYGARVVLRHGRDPDRTPQGVPQPPADRLRDRRPRLLDRARGHGHQGRAAGPVRHDVRRVQPDRVRRRSRHRQSAAHRSRRAARARAVPAALLHGDRAHRRSHHR